MVTEFLDNNNRELMHHGFLHIGWMTVHNCDMVLPNFKGLLYGVDENKTKKVCFSFFGSSRVSCHQKVVQTSFSIFIRLG